MRVHRGTRSNDRRRTATALGGHSRYLLQKKSRISPRGNEVPMKCGTALRAVLSRRGEAVSFSEDGFSTRPSTSHWSRERTVENPSYGSMGRHCKNLPASQRRAARVTPFSGTKTVRVKFHERACRNESLPTCDSTGIDTTGIDPTQSGSASPMIIRRSISLFWNPTAIGCRVPGSVTTS